MAARQFSDGRVCTPACGAAPPRAPLSAERAAAAGSAEPASVLGPPPPPREEGAALQPWLDLHRTMATAREIDRVELDLVRRGLAFFHVSGAGHEATACLARHLKPDDWLHVHYRDKALLLARGLPLEEFFASLLCRAGSHSEGRQMSAHFSAPRLNVLSQTGPVGNHALQAVGVAAARRVGIAHHEPTNGEASPVDGSVGNALCGVPLPTDGSSTGNSRTATAPAKRGYPVPYRESSSAGNPIVVCCVGDGTTQQGQFLEAIAEAVRSRLPVLFAIEDNHLAISTRTAGKTFWDLPDGAAQEFYGLPIVRVDGSDVPAVDRVFEQVVARMRDDRSPALVVLDIARLADHSNADDQDQYRDPCEVAEALATADPIRRLEDFLVDCGVGPNELREAHRQIAAEVEAAAARALARPEPTACHIAKGDERALDAAPRAYSSPHAPREGNHHAERDAYCTLTVPGGVAAEGHRESKVGNAHRNAHTTLLDGLGRLGRPSSGATERAEYTGQPGARELTMREALNGVLRHRLATDDRVFLYGQDIEDPKGDVFGVTRGLSTAFSGRVVNSPLSEATIVGTCVGRALAGQRPVAFIQFADFLPLAFNQIATELASMYWRTNGGWQCPVIVMVTCGGYKPGLGPFHSHTLESIAAHTPGLDVVMPSTAGDAAGLLNAAFESGRPTLFFYPKSCLNLAERATSADVERQYVPLGRARRVAICRERTPCRSANCETASPSDSLNTTEDDVCRERTPCRSANNEATSPPASRNGTESVPYRAPALTLVTWGNTIDQCQRAAEALAAAGVETELFDLRSLSPWDEWAIIASAERTGRLVVVHEDNHTCGFGAEVAATVAEKAARPVKIRRVTRPDTFVPCHFGNQFEILPSFKRVLETSADLLGLSVEWSSASDDDDPDIGVIRVTGSGPADDRVEVVEVRVTVGEQVGNGQVVAIVEAAKSVVDVLSDFSGTVVEVLALRGDRIAVGQPLVRVRLSSRSVSVSLASVGDGLPSPSRISQQSPPIDERPGVPVLRRVGIAHHEPTLGNAGPKNPGDSKVAAALRDGEPVAFGDRDLRHGVSDLHVAPQPNGASRPARATIFASRPACALGGRIVTTEEIAAKIPGWTAAEAIKRTGVERRHWIADGETAVSLATKAAAQLLDTLGPTTPKISAIFCSTTSPQEATPSISCQVLTHLRDRDCFADACFALDLNAACSGFLYGLRLAFDHIQGGAAGAVLLLTAEIISPQVSNYDPATVFLFGDAATATLVTRTAVAPQWLQVALPLLKSMPDSDRTLWSPNVGAGGYLEMDGIRVARAANKAMADVLVCALDQAGLTPHALAAIIPHPGSQRILESVAYRLGVDNARLLHTLAEAGNTSSSSIPLAIDRCWDTIPSGDAIAMTAFGAGYTFAACLALKCPMGQGSAAATGSALEQGVTRPASGTQDESECVRGTAVSMRLESQQ